MELIQPGIPIELVYQKYDQDPESESSEEPFEMRFYYTETHSAQQ